MWGEMWGGYKIGIMMKHEQEIVQRRFGKTELNVSGLGFGGAPIGYLESAQREVERVLNALLDAGVNVIDTAACYPGSEEAIGKAVADRRDEYVLVSKCGHRGDASDGENFSPNVIRKNIDRSLQRLNTDCIDVMLLHSCDMDVLQAGDALGAVVEAREAGKVRFAGYSGDNEAAAYAATLPDVAVIETSVNIVDQANIELVLPVTKKHDVGVIAKRPIGNACWKSAEEFEGVYQEYAKTYIERFLTMGLTLKELELESSNEESRAGSGGDSGGKNGGMDWVTVALRFVLSIEEVHTSIVGTTKADHVAHNLAALAKGALSGAAKAHIMTAFQTVADASWTGQT